MEYLIFYNNCQDYKTKVPELQKLTILMIVETRTKIF